MDWIGFLRARLVALGFVLLLSVYLAVVLALALALALALGRGSRLGLNRRALHHHFSVRVFLRHELNSNFYQRREGEKAIFLLRKR